MKTLPLLLAMFSAACNAAANISLRNAGLGREVAASIPTPFGAISDWYVVATGCYFVSFFAYALAIRDLSAPVAYPIIIGGAYLMTVAATWAIVREAVSAQTLVGGLIVVAGLVVIVSGQARGPTHA